MKKYRYRNYHLTILAQTEDVYLDTESALDLWNTNSTTCCTMTTAAITSNTLYKGYTARINVLISGAWFSIQTFIVHLIKMK